MRIVKDSPEDLAEQADFDLLEERLIPYPALAIAQCHRVMNGMAKKVRNNVNRSMNLINEFKPEKYDKVHRKENLIDKYEASKPFNSLEKAFLSYLKIKNIRELNHIFYQHTKDEIAKLSLFFKKEARKNNQEAIY